ncbi:MAG: carboxypeptidase-like regulatory domain-containing protein [Candidatus Eremiobacteraeota bacterium]|nr:carboxypeptidase-like regulatory domain-containing protein [Candidatus Eremiobacteraeota bacterium]
MKQPYVSAFFMLLIGVTGCSAIGGDPAVGGIGPKDSLGGVPASRYHMSASDAAPLLGNQLPSEVDLGIRRIDAVKSGTIVPLLSYSSPKIINFLNYQTQSLDLGSTQLALGTYDALRVIVDIPSSKVVLNGRTLPMSFVYGAPSLSTVNAGRETSTQQGTPGTANVLVKLPFSSQTALANGLRIDFNAAESLTLGTNNVVVRSTFFTAQEQSSGQIVGKILNLLRLPVSGATVVVTDASKNVVGTATTDKAGNFQFLAIPNGSYGSRIYNSYKTAVGQTNTALGQTVTGLLSVPGPLITLLPGLPLDLGTLKD